MRKLVSLLFATSTTFLASAWVLLLVDKARYTDIADQLAYASIAGNVTILAVFIAYAISKRS